MGLGAIYYVFLKNAFKGKLHCIHDKMLFNVNKENVNWIDNDIQFIKWTWEDRQSFDPSKVNLY